MPREKSTCAREINKGLFTSKIAAPIVVVSSVVVFVKVGLLGHDGGIEHVRRQGVQRGADQMIRTDPEALENQATDRLGEQTTTSTTATTTAAATADGHVRWGIPQEPLLIVTVKTTGLISVGRGEKESERRQNRSPRQVLEATSISAT